MAQGAFAGATSAPAAGRLAVDAVTEAAVPGGAEDTPDLELRGAMPVGGIVGDDDTAESDRNHPMTSQKAVRGVSQSVLEKILAGPPNQMTSGEAENLPEKDRGKRRSPRRKARD